MRAIPVGLFAVVVGCAGSEPPVGRTQNIPTLAAKELRAVELSGGTLAIAGGGRYAVVTDPDNDRLWVVDLSSSSIRGQVVFPNGSQPQRIVEDGSGKLRVALRGSGQIATASPSSLVVSELVDACPEVKGSNEHAAKVTAAAKFFIGPPLIRCADRDC